MLSLPRKQMLLHPQLPPAHPVAPGWHWTGGLQESAIPSADSSGEMVYKSWSRRDDSPIVESLFHTESRRKGEKKEFIFWTEQSWMLVTLQQLLLILHSNYLCITKHKLAAGRQFPPKVKAVSQFADSFFHCKFDMWLYSIFYFKKIIITAVRVLISPTTSFCE